MLETEEIPATWEEYIKKNTNFDLDEYQLMDEPKMGGNGFCFLLKKLENEQFYILKIAISDEKQVAEKFQKEAENLDKLEILLKPKFIKCNIDLTEKELSWILMDFIPGTSFESLIDKYHEKGSNITFDQILKILLLLTKIIGELHSLNYIHRDIKPNNIIIDPNYCPHLIDFGEVSEVGDKTNSSSNERVTPNFHGTSVFSPPEVIPALNKQQDDENKVTYTFKSDIYSLGATIFNAATGEHPYQDVFDFEQYDQFVKYTLENIKDENLKDMVIKLNDKIKLSNILNESNENWESIKQFSNEVKVTFYDDAALLNLFESESVGNFLEDCENNIKRNAKVILKYLIENKYKPYRFKKESKAYENLSIYHYVKCQISTFDT